MNYINYFSVLGIKNIYLRFLFYFFAWYLYLFFMSTNSPLGTDWLPWHYQRIFNFSEFLNLNGIFNNYGFSIWHRKDILLNPEHTKNSIYLSANLFSHLPYVILNKYFGDSFLREYGHLIDKTIILFTGILIAELFIKFNSNQNYSTINILKTLLIFILFIVNPWTYKMILAYWVQIFFVFFFLLGVLMFLSKKDNLGLTFFFISGLIDYQSAAGLFIYFSFFIIYSKINKNYISYDKFFPNVTRKKNIELKIIISFLLPVFIFFYLRSLVVDELNIYGAKLLFDRIGIGGNDIHNGGILGSLQFLGGNRLTQCLNNLNGDLLSIDLNSKIYIFNCSLSIIGMFLISIISLIGLLILNPKDKKLFNLILSPFLFLLISYTFILQKSSSTHLMGYSYFFSTLFSFGISSIIFKILYKYKYSPLTVILLFPSIAGIIFLCIRVSMLTGING